MVIIISHTPLFLLKLTKKKVAKKKVRQHPQGADPLHPPGLFVLKFLTSKPYPSVTFLYELTRPNAPLVA
jgi:hypothetical protein